MRAFKEKVRLLRDTIHKPVNRHHKKPRSRGGDDSERNIAIVDKHKHDLFHALWGNSTPQEIAKELSDTWCDPDYEIIVKYKLS